MSALFFSNPSFDAWTVQDDFAQHVGEAVDAPLVKRG